MPIPGQTWARVDRRILRDVLYLVRRYHVRIGDGYGSTATSCSASTRSASPWTSGRARAARWRTVSRLAKWAEPRQNHPRPPFRWVGWNGDFNHGDPSHCQLRRGCAPHLHLSWRTRAREAAPRGAHRVGVRRA